MDQVDGQQQVVSLALLSASALSMAAALPPPSGADSMDAAILPFSSLAPAIMDITLTIPGNCVHGDPFNHHSSDGAFGACV